MNVKHVLGLKCLPVSDYNTITKNELNVILAALCVQLVFAYLCNTCVVIIALYGLYDNFQNYAATHSMIFQS